jgi:hypothetical protein
MHRLEQKIPMEKYPTPRLSGILKHGDIAWQSTSDLSDGGRVHNLAMAAADAQKNTTQGCVRPKSEFCMN